ncbi:MAG: 23S rRNA (uracil(1939)-C(5))-methyltransferase RlmD [Tissierellia bacterium]|nr:23S rRNA (uracil(1939)-C(5))-methyltransferase RlmD [Tissierellia bacterium]
MDFNIGEELILDIIDINSEGMGVGKYEGFIFFIDNCTLGDKVRAEILELKKNFGIGKAVEIIEESLYRARSKCNFFPECNGCQLHNLDYKKQLELKRDTVKNNLERIGKIENVKINETIGMDNPYRYRNKADFKVDKNGNIGYFKRGSNDLIPIDRCIIQRESTDEIINDFKKYFKENGNEGIKDIIVRTTKSGETMVIVVTQTEGTGLFVWNQIKGTGLNIVSVYQNINPKNNSTVLGYKNIKLSGEDKIIDSIGEYKFYISPKSFFQVNPIQTEVLYNEVVEYLNLKGDEVVADLYCGIGTISLYISKQAKKVYGVEIVKDAIEDAKENAKLNNVDNVEFIRGKSEDILPKLNQQGIKIDAIVVDPPRKGLDKSLIDSIVKANPKKIVYVSCNSSTLARDLGYLVDGGYVVEEVQPVDMFPWTMHVEAVTLLVRELSPYNKPLLF